MGNVRAKRRLGSLALLFALVALMLPAMGATDNTQRFEDLGHKMMCTCSCGQILLECNHVGCPNSDGMRADLASAVASLPSDNDVINRFIKRYGPTVMAAPVFTGFNRLAWIMPIAVLLFGLAGSALLIDAWHKRRLHQHSALEALMPPPVEDSVRDRIRRETGE